MLLPSTRVVAAAAAVLISLSMSFSVATAQSWHVAVCGAVNDPAEIPFIAAVKDDVPAGRYSLESVAPAAVVEAQVFQENDRRFLAFILPRADARRSQHFELRRRLETRDARAGIGLRESGPNLAIDLDQKLLTIDRVDSGNKPFFFPLVGPTGDSLTRAYPMLTVPGEDRDHPHQKSCWFTHGNVNQVDFWGETRNSGTIRESARTIVASGPVVGRLATTNDWNRPDGKRVCQDQRITTFYATQDARVIDFEIKIVASDGPVTFGDTKEGTFGLRVASSMDVAKKTGGQITNAEGLTDDKAWGQASPWVDYVGPVNDKTAGVAILNHPASFRYPTTWHVRTYGLFAANPFGWHDFGKKEKGDYTVPHGQSITFRYRVILHNGDTGAAGLTQRFKSYAEPPRIEITKS
jgi:hypothetical protein